MVRHVSGCHSMSSRSSDFYSSRIRRFSRGSMSTKRGLPCLFDGCVATSPFASDRNRVTRASVTRMDFCKQRQNVFSTVSRTDPQLSRSRGLRAKPLPREASLVKEFCDRARLPKAHTSPLDVIRFLELLPQSQDALLCSFQSLVKDS